MITAKELELRQQEIVKDVNLRGQNLLENCSPITDGIADIEGYLSSPVKMTFVLLEPYDEIDANGNPAGGKWSLAEHFMKETDWNKIPTWACVAYIAHAIETGTSWDEIDELSDNPSLGNIIRRVNWVNLSKLPARTNSNTDNVINLHKQHWNDIVLRQLVEFPSDVYFFTSHVAERGIFDKFINASGKPEKNQTVVDGCRFTVYTSRDKVFVDMYHPAYIARPLMNSCRANYVNALVKQVRALLKK